MADVLPWPLPPDMDWTSEVTLTTLHDAHERYGALPKSKFRKTGKHYEQPYA